jgi:molybdopterin-guanine dinucleotide biosynthesis protein A
MRPAALVLCGGMSRRMGRPKALLPFGDEVLLLRVVRRLGAVAGPIVVVAAPDQPLPALPAGVRVAHDPVLGRGPLQGLATGMAALAEDAELVYATATDVPFLRPEWVARLVDRIGENDLAIPDIGGYLHPLAALYRRSTVQPAVAALLAADRLRPVFLRERVRTITLGEADVRDIDPDLDTLGNLNTPADYAAALRREGLAPPPLTFELYGVPRLRAGRATVEVAALSLRDAVAGLVRECPALAAILRPDGSLHPAYRLGLEGADFLTDLDQAVPPGARLLLLAADVGG